MRFKVVHTTRYSYSHPVFLEPQTIRLRPRSDASQNLLDFSLSVEPEPAGLVQVMDPEGNSVAHAWFNDLTERLVITSAFTAETLRTDPFDYILTDAGAQTLPLVYAEPWRRPLEPCLGDPRDIPEAVTELARNLSAECGGDTLAFLGRLSSWVHEQFRVIIRLEGDPHPAEYTLAERTGSCRDLAVLFIAACRAQGIAARFVSGYQEGDPDSSERHLHAWAEVYLPGGGWRGYDPTHGLAVTDRHVALAASYCPSNAAPVSGSLRADQAAAGLEFELNIRVEG